MTGTYDPRLVIQSVLIAMLAAFTALNLVQRVALSTGVARRAWLSVGALAAAAGLWSAQCLSMLSFQLPVTVVHHLPTLLFTLAFTAVVCFLALWLASGPRIGIVRLMVAGLCMGLGLAGTHFTGIFAMQIIPAIEYDIATLAWSVTLAVLACWLLLSLAFALRQRRTWLALLARAGGGVLAGAALAGAHFTALAAARFAADSYSLGATLDHAADSGDDLLIRLVVAAALGMFAALLLTSIDHARPAPSEGHLDELGLADRALLERRFGELHESSLDAGHAMALMRVELAGDAPAASTAGAAAMSAAVQEVARRLAALVRPGDTVARIEDAVFALLLPRLADPGAVAGIGSRVREEATRAIDAAATPQGLSLNIGCSLFPRDGEDLDTLLRMARRQPLAES